MTQQKTPTQMEQEMNAEIFRRNVPSSSLQPYLSVRPASTKYSIMPVVDPRRQLHVPLRVILPLIWPIPSILEMRQHPGLDMLPK